MKLLTEFSWSSGSRLWTQWRIFGFHKSWNPRDQMKIINPWRTTFRFTPEHLWVETNRSFYINSFHNSLTLFMHIRVFFLYSWTMFFVYTTEDTFRKMAATIPYYNMCLQPIYIHIFNTFHSTIILSYLGYLLSVILSVKPHLPSIDILT